MPLEVALRSPLGSLKSTSEVSLKCNSCSAAVELLWGEGTHTPHMVKFDTRGGWAPNLLSNLHNSAPGSPTGLGIRFQADLGKLYPNQGYRLESSHSSPKPPKTERQTDWQSKKIQEIQENAYYLRILVRSAQNHTPRPFGFRHF